MALGTEKKTEANERRVVTFNVALYLFLCNIFGYKIFIVPEILINNSVNFSFTLGALQSSNYSFFSFKLFFYKK